MKVERYVTPVMLIAIGIWFVILTLQLPTGNINNPMEPLYFPLFSAVGLILFGSIYLIQEVRINKVLEKTMQEIPAKTLFTKIVILLAFTILYALLFVPLGFIFSSILYLTSILFYLNGFKKWLINILAGIILPISFGLVFSMLLNVNLP